MTDEIAEEKAVSGGCFRGRRRSEASFGAHATRFLANSAGRCAGRLDAIMQRRDIPHVG
jgi:hypothetical protein